MTCPHCGNSDTRMMEVLATDKHGTKIVGCVVCAKTFNVPENLKA